MAVCFREDMLFIFIFIILAYYIFISLIAHEMKKTELPIKPLPPPPTTVEKEKEEILPVQTTALREEPRITIFPVTTIRQIDPIPRSITPIGNGIYVDTSTGPTKTEMRYDDTKNYYEIGFVQSTTSEARYKLFARRMYPRVDKFEYYILDNTGIKISIKRNTTKELDDGNEISIEGYSSPFTVRIYDTYSPRIQAP